MKKIKMLVNSIVNGSIGTQIIAGVVAVSVLGGAVFGGYKVYNRIQEQKQVKASVEEKKNLIESGIKVLEENLAKLPEDEDTANLKSGLEELKSMDLETQYDEAYEKFCSLDEELNSLTAKYKDEMSELYTNLQSLDLNLLNEDEISSYKEVLTKYSNAVNNSDYKNYKTIYEEVINKYNELLSQAQAREEASNETILETEQVASNTSSGSSSNSSSNTPSGSSSNSSSNNSSSGSSNSSSNNSSSGSSNSSSDSNQGSATVNSGSNSNSNWYEGEANIEESKPSSSNNSGSTSNNSIPSGYKNDIASQVVSYQSNVNTNNYDTSSYYFSHTPDMYNSYLSIAQSFVNGSLSQSSAVAQLQSISGSYMDLKYTYGNSQVVKFTIDGCDAKSISDYLTKNSVYIAPSFVYCSVYYDSSSNQSTVWFVKVGVNAGF